MLADTDRPKIREPRRLKFSHILRTIFIDDWAIKLTALVITFGLWFGVTGLSTPTTKRLTVPLVPSISNNIEITSSPIQEVDIVVSGDKRKIDQINRNDLVASLDLTDIAPGDRVISLSPDNVSVALPQGVRLDEVQPSRIAVKLEAVEEKEIAVRAQTSGSVEAGFEVYSVAVLPPRIRVRGPAGFISTLEFIDTDSIDLTGKHEDFTARQVPVGIENPKASVLNTVVDVFFRIGERRVERLFNVSIPGSEDKTATFTLYGPRRMLSNLRADSFGFEAANEGANEYNLILPAEIRDRVELRSLSVR